MKAILVICFMLFSILGVAKPKWIEDVRTLRVCKKKQLCALGVGTSVSWAKRDATTALAKMFSMKISSKFSSTLSNYGEDASEQLEEFTSAVLEGVTILKIYEGKTQVYAVAAINKGKAARRLRSQIHKLDKQMQSLMKQKEFKAIQSLEKLYLQREILNQRHLFLTGGEIPSPISHDHILVKKRKLHNIVVKVFTEGGDALETIIATALTDRGVRVIRGNHPGTAKFFVVGKILVKKQYMKVKGFVKYLFTFNLSAKSNSGVETGNLSFQTTETGRTYRQAFDQCLQKIKNFVDDNIGSLDIE